MILVAVLGAIGIIYILVTQMSADAVFTAQYYDKIAFKEKAYYISRSAFAGVTSIFALDDASYDSYLDPWAQPLPPYELQDEQITLSVQVEDQERFFNPNSIMSGDELDEKHYKQFKRLLYVMLIDENLVNAVADWIDTDQERRSPMGADGLDYSDQYPVKGGALDSVDELKLIKGFEEEYFSGKVQSGKAVPGLKDVLSTKTNGKININTAKLEVLMSLDEEVTEEMAAEIIRRREEKPFKSMDDLVDLPGMSHDLLYKIKQLADVKSEYFKITVTVERLDKESADLTVIVQRSGQAGKIVFWQAE